MDRCEHEFASCDWADQSAILQVIVDSGLDAWWLRKDMRNSDDSDEVDLAIIGCGAGGSTPVATPRQKGLEGRRPRRE